MSEKTPADLSGKRRKAYKAVMKATAEKPRSIMVIDTVLSDIYKTKESRKEAIKTFAKSPEIPINLKGQTVENLA